MGHAPQAGLSAISTGSGAWCVNSTPYCGWRRSSWPRRCSFAPAAWGPCWPQQLIGSPAVGPSGPTRYGPGQPRRPPRRNEPRPSLPRAIDLPARLRARQTGPQHHRTPHQPPPLKAEGTSLADRLGGKRCDDSLNPPRTHALGTDRARSRRAWGRRLSLRRPVWQTRVTQWLLGQVGNASHRRQPCKVRWERQQNSRRAMCRTAGCLPTSLLGATTTPLGCTSTPRADRRGNQASLPRLRPKASCQAFGIWRAA